MRYDMDVSEATSRKHEMEYKIQELVNQYEEDTGTRVTNIKVERRHFSHRTDNIKVTAEV